MGEKEMETQVVAQSVSNFDTHTHTYLGIVSKGQKLLQQIQGGVWESTLLPAPGPWTYFE